MIEHGTDFYAGGPEVAGDDLTSIGHRILLYDEEAN
jgi:hypothetical protein